METTPLLILQEQHVEYGTYIPNVRINIQTTMTLFNVKLLKKSIGNHKIIFISKLFDHTIK